MSEPRAKRIFSASEKAVRDRIARQREDQYNSTFSNVRNDGTILDRISEYLPMSCGPRERCLRDTDGIHIRNTGRTCLLPSVLSSPPASTEMTCWESGWVDYADSSRFHHFARFLVATPPPSLDTVLLAIMIDYYDKMGETAETVVLTPFFRERATLALVRNHENELFECLYNNVSSDACEWFFKPRFLVRVMRNLLNKGVESGNRSHWRCGMFVRIIIAHFCTKHDVRDTGFHKTFEEYVIDILVRMSGVPPRLRQDIMNEFGQTLMASPMYREATNSNTTS